MTAKRGNHLTQSDLAFKRSKMTKYKVRKLQKPGRRPWTRTGLVFKRSWPIKADNSPGSSSRLPSTCRGWPTPSSVGPWGTWTCRCRSQPWCLREEWAIRILNWAKTKGCTPLQKKSLPRGKLLKLRHCQLRVTKVIRIIGQPFLIRRLKCKVVGGCGPRWSGEAEKSLSKWIYSKAITRIPFNGRVRLQQIQA